MRVIRTIDLWTEQYENHYDIFNGAFVDCIEENYSPFDEYKVVYNCNCIISSSKSDISVPNKHHAIIFYKDKDPVRLVAIDKNTDIEKCIAIALNQQFNNSPLKDLYEKFNIKRINIDMKENPIYNNADNKIDIGSCDRWSLLYILLKGYYTESNTSYGHIESNSYEFIPDLYIKYELLSDTEKFEIEHKCAFINASKTRLIPIQENSKLTS